MEQKQTKQYEYEQQCAEKQRNERLQAEIREYKRRCYGDRYAEACLSRILAEPKTLDTMFKFIKNPKHVLLYHGTPGCGKTYFCAAITEWSFLSFNSRRRHTEEDLLRRLRQSMNEGYGDYLINLEYLIDDDFVILDDVGSGITPDKVTYRDLEFRREVFFSFLDYRYRTQKPTVITSNFTKNDFISVYSERICDRLFAKENNIISVFGENTSKRQQGM